MIIELESKTHPKAEILSIDIQKKALIFRWIDGPYGGDCSTPLDVAAIAAIAELVSPSVTAVIDVVAKDADALVDISLG